MNGITRSVVVLGMIVGCSAFLLGCGIAQRQAAIQAAQERAAAFQTQVRDIIVECRNRKARGQYRTYSEVVQCVTEPLYAAYRGVGFPYMDLVTLALAEIRVEAEKTDKGMITVAQLNVRMAEIQSAAIDKARDRMIEATKARAAQTQATAAVLQATAPQPSTSPIFSYRPPLNCITMTIRPGFDNTSCQ